VNLKISSPADLNFSRVFLGLYGTLLFIGLLTMVIASSYFALRPLEMLSFRANDEWCDQVTSGVGNHCFSDYQTPMNLVREVNPWVFGNSFTPTAMFPHILSGWAKYGFIGPEFTLYLYLILGIIAISLPIYFALHSMSIFLRIPSALSLSVLSTAGLNSLDRGTSAIFATPFIYLAAREFLKKNPRNVLMWVLLASFIRPQFILLSLFLLALPAIKHFLISIGIFLISIILGFTFWPGDRKLHWQSWLNMISGYDQYAPSVSDWPINISAGKSLAKITSFFTEKFPSHNISSDLNVWALENFKLIGIILAISVVTIAGVFGKNISQTIVVVLVCTSPALIPGVSWAYYTIVFVPIAALIISLNSQMNGMLDRESKINSVIKMHILFTTAFVLSPLVLPYLSNPSLLSPYDPPFTSLLAQFQGPLILLLVIDLILVGAWQIMKSFKPFLLKTH
jgi:hypothetical protein